MFYIIIDRMIWALTPDFKHMTGQIQLQIGATFSQRYSLSDEWMSEIGHFDVDFCHMNHFNFFTVVTLFSVELKWKMSNIRSSRDLKMCKSDHKGSVNLKT